MFNIVFAAGIKQGSNTYQRVAPETGDRVSSKSKTDILITGSKIQVFFRFRI
jgi:hypothetical protein